MENIRLVIWDLDETFWEGTLSEGGIKSHLNQNEKIVIELSKRGIMNSICSKNNFDEVKKILEERGLWEYFIFPSIDWSSKGPRVKEIVEKIGLRQPSIIFIDDNNLNLAEIKHHLPEINISDPSIIQKILTHESFQGKLDIDLSRLKQYKILENKELDKKNTEINGDNSLFLKQSNINVVIDYDLISNIERVWELLNRTNQLNFTKHRITSESDKEIFLNNISNVAYNAGLIRVTDKYGDYGYVGLYVIFRDRDLEHFCFSCRILGMGIETWLYQKLGSPYLDIKGEVLLNPKEPTIIDWINQSNISSLSDQNQFNKFSSIRLIGGCDVTAIGHYLKNSTDNLIVRSSFFDGGIFVKYDSSFFNNIYYEKNSLFNFFELPSIEIEQLNSISENSLIVFNFSGDLDYPLYKHKNFDFYLPITTPSTGDLLPLDLTQSNEEQINAFITKMEKYGNLNHLLEVISNLKNDWFFYGIPDLDLIVSSIKSCIALMPKSSRVVLVTPATLGPNCNSSDRFELKNRLKYIATESANTFIVDYDECIFNLSDVQDKWHYDRLVYARIAELILKVSL